MGGEPLTGAALAALNPQASRIALPADTLGRLAASILKVVDAEEIYVFGSYARGEQTPDSDLDVFVVAEDDSARSLGRIRGELGWLKMHLDIMTERRSLYDRGRTRPGLVEHDVAGEGVRIYG